MYIYIVEKHSSVIHFSQSPESLLTEEQIQVVSVTACIGLTEGAHKIIPVFVVQPINVELDLFFFFFSEKLHSQAVKI